MTITDLIEQLQPDVPGCPSATLRDMLRWAQRMLCTEGTAWVHREGPVVVGAKTDSPEIETPPGAEVLRIFTLLDAGRELIPGADYWQPTAATIEFMREPSADELDGSLVCRPAAGRDMPADLLSRWDQALIHGAKSRLFALPQPWRDMALSEYHSQYFQNAQVESKHLASAGHQQGSLRMQVPPFI